MGREYEPTVGQWYDDLENDETFQVLKVDEDQETIQIQHLDGDTEELDVDDWAELDLELTEEPRVVRLQGRKGRRRRGRRRGLGRRRR